MTTIILVDRDGKEIGEVETSNWDGRGSAPRKIRYNGEDFERVSGTLRLKAVFRRINCPACGDEHDGEICPSQY